MFNNFFSWKKLSLNQRIRGFTTMRYISLRFTYLLTYIVGVKLLQMLIHA